MPRQHTTRTITQNQSVSAGAVWPPDNGNPNYLSGALKPREGKWSNQQWLIDAYQREFGALAADEILVIKLTFATQEEVDAGEARGVSIPEARLWIDKVKRGQRNAAVAPEAPDEIDEEEDEVPF